MEFVDLHVTFTDRCNFNCDYCYQRDNQTLHDLPLKEAFKMLDFFYPYLRDETNYLSFYGGEPLLEFGKIKKTVEYNEDKRKEAGKNFIYSMTTNGSLITDEVIDFFDKYNFRILLSLDGMAQETHRKEGTFDRVVDAARKMMNSPSIKVGFNCVVTPRTVSSLSDSVSFFLDSRIPEFRYSPNYSDDWGEDDLNTYSIQIKKVREMMTGYYQKSETIPLKNFSSQTKDLAKVCMGGVRRLAMVADGTLWGCSRMADCYKEKTDSEYYDKYCFGHLDDFRKNHKKTFPRVFDEYMKLTLDRNWLPGKFCQMCDLVSECWVCPIVEGFRGNIPGRLSESTCKIRQIDIRERRQFYKDIGKENP